MYSNHLFFFIYNIEKSFLQCTLYVFLLNIVTFQSFANWDSRCLFRNQCSFQLQSKKISRNTRNTIISLSDKLHADPPGSALLRKMRQGSHNSDPKLCTWLFIIRQMLQDRISVEAPLIWVTARLLEEVCVTKIWKGRKASQSSAWVSLILSLFFSSLILFLSCWLQL